ncbi:MAG: hypothetical protein ACREQX_16560 [Candidatus Binataceae bacterium]
MRYLRHVSFMVAILAICGMLAASLPAAAQSAASPGPGANASSTNQHQLDLQAARAERKAIVGSNMHLTAKQAKMFWPLYDKYEARMDKIEDAHAREIKEYAANYDHLTDSAATKKLNQVIKIRERSLDTQKAFIPKFRAELPSVAVTRFFQIDSKLRALVQCQIAQMVPLAHPASAEQGGSSSAQGQ